MFGFYTEEFHQKALAEYFAGKSAKQIFIDAGIDLNIIDPKNAIYNLYEWRKLANNNSGKYNKALKKALAKIKYLEAENELLKNTGAGKRFQVSPAFKYKIISTIKDVPVYELCKVAEVSKSGYYHWLKNKDIIKNEDEILLIANIFFKSKQKAGFRTIKMILKKEFEIIMNHKKIIRIMQKYDLRTRIRRKNNFREKMNIAISDRICPNLVKAEFKNKNPILIIARITLPSKTSLDI